MVAREDLLVPLFAGLLVLFLHHLGVVFQNVGQARLGEGLLPQIVGGKPGRVGRIASAIVVALVEGQKPRALALEVGAETHLVIVHGKVDGAAAELEQQLLRVPVALVLLHGIENRLFGELIFEFEGGDGQAVDEHGHVEGERSLIAAVAELAGDAEDVGREPLGHLHVAWRRRAVEKVHMGRAVLDAAAQHVYHAALGDLALKAVQELGALGAFLVNAESLVGVGLSGREELQQLGQVDSVFPVVVLRITLNVSGLLHEGRDDDGLQALFAGVGRFHRSSSKWAMSFGDGS